MILRAIFIFLILKNTLFACSDFWNEHDVEFLFLEKKDNIYLGYKEDLNLASIYSDILSQFEIKNKEANLLEWEIALKNRYSKEEIENFIYKKKNLSSLKDIEALEYIKFAQAQESCATYSYYEDRPTNCKEFIPKAIEKIEKVNSEFLKQRYFYLAFRLAHYNKEKPLEIYEKYSHLTKNSNSIVKDWVQGLYAGALVKNNKKVEGIYEFTKLFDSSINSHLAIYNFFHIKTQEEFDALLNLASNSDEKSKIYTLRALDSGSNSIVEMQNIYAIDKNSKWLDFLLYKELSISQKYFNSYNDNLDIDNIFYKKYIDFLNNLERKDSFLVDLSLVYFNLYSKNFDKSKEIVDTLLKEFPNSHEAQIASYVLYLNTLTKIDSKIEDDIYLKLEKLIDENHRSNGVFEYTLQVLEKLYEKQGLNFDQFLVNNSLHIDYRNLDLEMLRKYEDFLQRPQTSKFKTYIQSKSNDIIGNEKGTNKFEFNYTKTTILVNNLLFKEALEAKNTFLDTKLDFNPFNVSINGNNRKGKTKTITTKEFLEKIIVIQNELKKNPTSVMDNFLYANAMYNLSYFGNSSRITSISRTYLEIHTPDLQEEKLNLALKYYEVALNESSDNELKAKITYQIAKVKLALHDLKTSYDGTPQQMSLYKEKSKYNYGSSDSFYEDFLKYGQGAKYFDILKNDFSNTKYYKEILKECGDFRTYQNSKD